MLSSTRKDYKEKYDSRLSKHEKDYIENDVTSFLEQELNNYTEYLNSLIKIANYFKNKTSKDLRVNPAITAVISDLKKANKPVFNEIFTIEQTRVVTDKVELERGYEDEMIRGFIPGKVEIDFTKLKNYITSAKGILGFIEDEKSKLQISITPEGQKGGTVTGEDESGKKEEPKDVAENDYTKSTIEDCLYNIKDDINPDQYETLVDALYHYFTTDKFPKLECKIMFKRVNKKKVGWALKEAYKNLKTDYLSIEYLQFAKDNIKLFENEKIETENFKQSKFYKYFTTKP